MTTEYIAWYLDPKIDLNGNLSGGKLLQKIPSSEWYSLNTSCKKFPLPAPFDVPFHLVIGLSVGDERYCNKSICQPPKKITNQKMIIESIKIYQL